MRCLFDNCLNQVQGQSIAVAGVDATSVPDIVGYICDPHAEALRKRDILSLQATFTSEPLENHLTAQAQGTPHA